MAQRSPNLALLSPHLQFASPDDRSRSRSPSRSPRRRQQFLSEEVDPLLSNLSPSSTLEALRATDAVPSEPGSQQRLLSESIADASTSERALGIRAAVAGKKLREWFYEAKGWQWPRSQFEEPSPEEMIRENNSLGHGGNLNKVMHEKGEFSNGLKGNETGVYWGSLPAYHVQELEQRIEEIRDDMEALEIEELKDHIRGAHLNSKARPSSLSSTDEGRPLTRNYEVLDDFTAIVTATIMHALPYLARLNRLLDIWFVRLVVLRQVPDFLWLLKDSQIAMESAWSAVGRTEDPGVVQRSDLSRQAFQTMKSILQERVSGLGARLDAMLDALEGGNEQLPDHWIDSMEGVQEDYELWVVDAERLVDENEWELQREVAQSKSTSEAKTEQIDLKKEGHPTEKSLHQACSAVQNMKQPVATLAESQKLVLNSAAKDHDTNSGLLNGGLYDVPAATFPTEFSKDKGATASDPDPNAHLANAESGRKGIPDDEKSQIPIPLPLERLPAANLASQDVNDHYPNTYISLDKQVPTDHGVGQHHSTNYANRLPEELLSMQGQDISTLDGSSSFINQSQKIWDVQPGLDSSVGKDSVQPPALLKSTKGRPPPLDFNPSHTRTTSTSSDVSYSGSASSGAFSNMSSPEILDARVEYFRSPTEDKISNWPPNDSLPSGDGVSRQSSQRTERSSITVRENFPSFDSTSTPNSRTRASSFIPEPTIYETAQPYIESAESSPNVQLKRASVTSLEIFPRSDVRNILVRRSGSYSSTSSAPLHPREVCTPVGPLDETILPDQSKPIDEKLVAIQLEGLAAAVSDRSRSPSLISGSHQWPVVEERSNEIANSPGMVPNLQPQSNLNLVTEAELEPTFVDRTGSDSLADKRKETRSSTGSSSNSLKTIEEQLTDKISSILTNIPANIRLTSGPGPNAPDVRPLRNVSGTKKDNLQTPPTRLARTPSSSTPSITLAPAFSSASKSRSQNAESDIKLYHLHQPGKDIPIKLYVRLIGEGGQRVMVRVGGGWADLGEYLKEYAIHHGRRSVSDGRFEIKGLPTGHSTSSITTLAGLTTARTPPSSRPGSPTTRPGSAINIRKSRHPSLSAAEAPITPDLPTRAFDATPGSADSYASSIRSSSRLSYTEDDTPLGLAGPKSKRVDISPKKQAWVDGMLDQARMASGGERKKAGVSDLGDLGIIGSTKRVFLKSKKEE